VGEKKNRRGAGGRGGEKGRRWKIKKNFES
jgi:hypothetical protein